MTERILIVEDAPSLRKSLRRSMELEGFVVHEAGDGMEGLKCARLNRPSLVLTDAEMPAMRGHALCRSVKEDPELSAVPVIIMSGEMVEESDIVTGLDGGADDYLIKPFPMKVLLSRIRAVLRRFAPAAPARERLKAHGIELDPAAREVRVAGKRVALTRKEFDLLALFLESCGRVVTSAYLLETLWGYDLADYNDPHTVETHVSRLRRKLGPGAAQWLVNLRGVGYKFEV